MNLARSCLSVCITTDTHVHCCRTCLWFMFIYVPRLLHVLVLNDTPFELDAIVPCCQYTTQQLVEHLKGGRDALGAK